MIDSNDQNYNLLFTKGNDSDKLTYQDIQNIMNIRNQELKGKIKFVFDQRAIQVYFRETFGITKMTSSKRIAGGKTAKAFVGVKLRTYNEIECLLEPVSDMATVDNEIVNNLIGVNNTDADVFDDDYDL